MKVLTVFKALAVALLISTSLIIIYCWSQERPRSIIREESSLFQHQWTLLQGQLQFPAQGRLAGSLHQQLTVTGTHNKTVRRSSNVRENSIHKLHMSNLKKGKLKNNNVQSLLKVQSLHRVPPEILGKKEGQDLLNSLSPEVINGVNKFVFFVGYARSGHSIIGTLMDAHPHVVISNEFNLFEHFSELNKTPSSIWRETLYNLLYSRSIKDVWRSRASPNKGYKLKVSGLWQGRFDKYIEVIGDKSGDITTKAYSVDEEQFLRNYRKLKSEVSVPLRIIHTVRNPFDMISTSVVIMHEDQGRFRDLKRTFNSNSTKLDGRNDSVYKYDNIAVVDGNIRIFFKRINTVMKLIEIFGRENVLDVHSCDLVADPRRTFSEIFEFLGVDTTEHYLDTCAEKVFKSVSRSRNIVGWTPEQIEKLEKGMKNYDVLGRYSFTSD